MQRIMAMHNSRRLVDLAEQGILLALYCWLIARMLPEHFPPQNWVSLMLLVSEGVVVAFVLARSPTDRISVSPRDWVVAFAGTFAVLLVGKGGEPLLGPTGGLLLLVGFAIHFGAKLSLWRSFGVVPADRGIKTRGLYAVVRHPMYFGYVISHLGFFLAAPSYWNAVVYLCAWSLFVARILAEEKILSTNSEYRAYQKKVRYRLMPGVF